MNNYTPYEVLHVTEGNSQTPYFLAGEWQPVRDVSVPMYKKDLGDRKEEPINLLTLAQMYSQISTPDGEYLDPQELSIDKFKTHATQRRIAVRSVDDHINGALSLALRGGLFGAEYSF